MNRDEGMAVLLGCMNDGEAAADETLCENLGYEEVIAALVSALFGDWDGASLH